MGKDNTAKTILIVGGVGLGVYLLSSSSIRTQLEDAISKLTANLPGGGGGGGGGITLPNFNLPSFQLPSFQLPGVDLTAGLGDLLGGLDVGADLGGLGDLLGGMTDLFKPEQGATGPAEHATWADVAYSLPSWAKGAMAVGATGLGGYGGYQVIRVTAPALRALGTQAARGVGGAGNILANLVRTAAAPRAAAVPIATKAATGGLIAGLLPGLAISGMIEGAYQIVRTFTGAEHVGMTGVPPLDIINWIRGKFQLGPSATPAPNLFDALFGALFKTAGASELPAAGAPPGGGSPAGIGVYGPKGGSGGGSSTNSWCEAWGPEPAELKEVAAYEQLVQVLSQKPQAVGQPPPEVIAQRIWAQE